MPVTTYSVTTCTSMRQIPYELIACGMALKLLANIAAMCMALKLLACLWYGPRDKILET